MVLTLHIALILGISIVALLISLTLDALFAPLPGPLQFIVQVPLIVLSMDSLRVWIAPYAVQQGILNDQVNSAFFLAAPLAALGSRSLFADIRHMI